MAQLPLLNALRRAAIEAGYAIALALLLMLALMPLALSAQEPNRLIDCGQLAQIIERLATFRDLEANEAKVIERMRELNPHISQAHRDIIAREIRRLWREGLPPDLAAARVFELCTKQLGDMGTEG